MAQGLYLIVAIAALAALNACGGHNPDPDRISTDSDSSTRTLTTTTSGTTTTTTNPTLVRIAPATVNIATGSSVQFAATVLPAGAPTEVIWSVTGPSCSTADCGQVDASGHYTAPTSPPATPTITLSAASTAAPTVVGTAVVTIGPQAGGTFVPTGDMTMARVGHSATLLADGRVLVVGGNGDAARSAELYDPATGTFTPTGALSMSRSNHTATLLPNGQVLIIGPDTSCGAELYDPATGTFTLLSAMLSQQWVQFAMLLGDGTVLVAGNIDAEIFDPATRIYRRVGPYASSYAATATLLADGRVFFVGDDPSQLYDPASETFSTSGSLSEVGIYGIWAQSATLLNNGKVLITGGSSEEIGRFALAELYDPATGTFRATGSLLEPRDSHASVLLRDGQVLIVGGEGSKCSLGNGASCWWLVRTDLASAEIYSPSAGTFATAGNMSLERLGLRATLLNNGDVLITGGSHEVCNADGCEIQAIAGAELYRPR